MKSWGNNRKRLTQAVFQNNVLVALIAPLGNLVADNDLGTVQCEVPSALQVRRARAPDRRASDAQGLHDQRHGKLHIRRCQDVRSVELPRLPCLFKHLQIA